MSKMQNSKNAKNHRKQNAVAKFCALLLRSHKNSASGAENATWLDRL